MDYRMIGNLTNTNNHYYPETINMFPEIATGDVFVHEVGHYLGLYHTFNDSCVNWQDNILGASGDYVCDTEAPSILGYRYCNNYLACNGIDSIFPNNYMDYTDDRGMYMFTTGQKSRMAAIFVSGGPRFSFGQP